MTKEQEKILDRLFQELILARCKGKATLGGIADCVHHIVEGKNKSIRWYVPGGIPVTQFQHNIFHSSDPRRKKYMEKLELIKGKGWLKKIERQKFIPAKYIKFEKVLDHLNGLEDNYI